MIGSGLVRNAVPVRYDSGQVDVNLGAGAGLVVGAAGGAIVGSAIKRSFLADVVVKGVASQVGGAVGGATANLATPTISAGLAVKVAGEHTQGAGSFKRLIVDGTAAFLGKHGVESRGAIADGIQKLAASVPHAQAPAKLLADSVRNGPEIAGTVIGSGVAVKKANWAVSHAPALLALAGAGVGCLVLANVLDLHALIGDKK